MAKDKKGAIRKMLSGPGGGIVLALAVLGVAAAVSVRQCSTPPPRAGYEYKRAGGDTINVAIDYSPMSLYRYGDSLRGLNYELLREMGRMYGTPVKFYPVASVTEAMKDLRRGKYDLVVSDLPVTSRGRSEEGLRLTEPVYLDRQMVISSDTAIRTPLDLAGREVWVVAGSPAQERLENLEREIGADIRIRPDSVHSAEQLYLLTSSGAVPAAVVNSGLARALSAGHPGPSIATPVSMTQFQSWAASSLRPALADSIDARLGRFKQTSAYDSILRRYDLP